MNRIEFMHSIDQKGREFASTVIGFFDQYMALYTMVENYENVNIINDSNESETVIFTLNFDSEDKAVQLMNIIAASGNTIIIYDRRFTIAVKPISNLSLSISLF